MKKIISYTWFNTLSHCMGVVIVQKPNGEKKAYLGVVPGNDEKQDAIHIAENGAKFSLGAARILIVDFGEILDEPIEFPL